MTNSACNFNSEKFLELGKKLFDKYEYTRTYGYLNTISVFYMAVIHWVLSITVYLFRLCSQSLHHQVSHGQQDKSPGMLCCTLIILCQSPAAFQPGKGTFLNPAPGTQVETGTLRLVR